jgi:uncharacterized membrane protein YhaH (DUF805 family)
MSHIWLYLSPRGRLSPAAFVRAFWVLFLVGLAATELMPTQRTIGFPLNHLAGLAYALTAAWPWLAITLKRLRDADRPVALAVPAALALPLAYAATLAADGALATPAFYAMVATALATYAGWGVLMWHVYRLPRMPGQHRLAARGDDLPSPARGEGGERSEPGEGRSESQSKLREPLTPALSPTGRGGAPARGPA